MPKRKSLRLKAFDYSSNGAYYVTVCVEGKRQLLGEVVGGAHPGAPAVRLSELGHMVKTHIENIDAVYNNVSVEKYVVMPNHIHIILLVAHERDTGCGNNARDARCASPTKSVIAKVINALKSLTSRQFGKTLWQRSYHDHIIRNQADYQTKWQYIDQNPAKWADDEYYNQQKGGAI